MGMKFKITSQKTTTVCSELHSLLLRRFLLTCRIQYVTTPGHCTSVRCACCKLQKGDKRSHK